MTDTNMYFKQLKLLDCSDFQPKVYVYGCGSIGSHVVIGLAKMGFDNVTVIDFDKTEESNIPAQWFDIDSIDSFKVHNMVRLVAQFTRKIFTHVRTKIDPTFKPDISKDSIHILCFDNIEARKIIFNKLIGFPVKLIDGRIGGFQFERYYLDCSHPKACIEFEKSLNLQYAELQCGEKTLWGVNCLIASHIFAILIQIYGGKDVPFIIKGHLLDTNVIKKQI